MQKTTNYGLNKPENIDFYDVAHFNENADIIDRELMERVKKENGKGLSTNDFDNVYKEKIDNIKVINNTLDKDKIVNAAIHDGDGNVIVDSYPTKTVTGKNPTASNSTDGKLIYLNEGGYTNQSQLAFDGKVTTTTKGIKNTNPILCKNGDSIVVTTSDVIGSVSVYNSNNEALFAIPKTESQLTTLSFTIDSDVSGIIIDVETTSTTMEVTVNNSVYATPTPDTPIHISSNGDKGYFDGELRQGYYNKDNGIYSTTNVQQDICCKNPIIVNGNDKVEICHEEVVNAIRILYYDNTDNFISSEMKGNTSGTPTTSSAEFTVPSNCKYIRFNLYRASNITPSTAKHICVTINGMYALRVMSCNKNLASKMIYNPTLSNYSSLIYEVGANIQKGKTYTASVDLTCDASTRAYWNVSSGIFANKDFYVSSGTNRYSYTFEALADKTDSSSILFLSKSGTSDNVRITPSNFQLEEGTVATDYEPHKSTTSLIPISAPLYDGDYIELYADGSGQEYRENYKVTLDGSQAIDSLTVLSKCVRACIVHGQVGKTALENTSCSSHLIENINYNLDNEHIYTNEKCCFVFVEKERLSSNDSSGIKEYLNNNNIDAVFKLATPTSTPLTAEQVQAFRQLQTFKGVTHINADGEVAVRYYCNNDSGDTVGMLHGMIEDVENKSTFISDKEQQVGYFLGKPLYMATIERTYSSINVITTGVDTPLNSSDGLIPDGSHLISGIDELVKADSLVETSTYKYVNALSIKKDKTGYYYVRNIVGESMPATRLVITFYYTKYQGIS